MFYGFKSVVMNLLTVIKRAHKKCAGIATKSIYQKNEFESINQVQQHLESIVKELSLATNMSFFF